MSNFDILELCFRNLFRRRMRTILAISGVIIGTFAIVIMLSIGFGLEDSFQRQIEGWGNLRMIDVFQGGRPGMGMPGDERGIINDRAIEAMENMPGVVAVTPVVSEWSLILRVGREIAHVSILGVRPEVLEKFNYEVSEGRMLHESDRNAILFGSQVPYFFWDPNSPIWTDTPANVITDRITMSGDPNFGRRSSGGSGSGQSGDFQEYRMRGIGILAPTNGQTDFQAFMHIDELEKIQEDLRRARGETIFRGATRTYDRAIIYVETINDSARISNQLRDLDFWTHSPADWLESMRETARMIQGVLGGIGAVSLLVAALGITNTMIMSIYERTKEIGVMKVVGANIKDIRKMFLLEAGLIGFIGGAMGLALSYILSFLMNTVLSEAIGMALGGMFWGAGAGSISIIPWWVAVSALVFSTIIGMVAGFYPARRAMNLSALESLRNE